MVNKNELIVDIKLTEHLVNILSGKILNKNNFNCLFILSTEEKQNLRWWSGARKEFLFGLNEIYKEEFNSSDSSFDFFWLMRISQNLNPCCLIFLDFKGQSIGDVENSIFFKRTMNLWFNICLRYGFISFDNLLKFRDNNFKSLVVVHDEVLIAYFLKNNANYISIFNLNKNNFFDLLAKTLSEYYQMLGDVDLPGNLYIGYSDQIINQLNIDSKIISEKQFIVSDLLNTFDFKKIDLMLVLLFENKLKINLKKIDLKNWNLKAKYL